MQRPLDVNRAHPAANQSRLDPELESARDLYEYREPAENQLYPICVSKSWPSSEQYNLDWAVPMLPVIGGAAANRIAKGLLFALEKATFRFDKASAYRELFPDLFPWRRPAFAREMDADTHDALFGYCRVGGANPLLLRREDNLAALHSRIPFDTKRIEERLDARYKVVSLEEEADEGRLFSVDFSVIQSSIDNDRTRDPRERDKYVQTNGRARDSRGRERDWPGSRHTRDSRWREKYLPAPIGVFLEAPGFYPGSSLVPLAIQIDQPQLQERNPVYYPDDGWGWRIAMLYFEAADVAFNSACGHVLRTHLSMEPFCMATPRQLSRDHKVRVLLEPHTRYTLAANSGAYDSFIDRTKTYYDFYSGTLDEHRQIAIQSFRDGPRFFELELAADLESRRVDRTPVDYPYRDDALQWRGVIRDFVTEYIDACYSDDAYVHGDVQLQEWYAELVHEDGGRLREPVPGNALDTKQKLVDLLAQVLFIAGPGHASQHYTSTYYYRYAPVFPGAAYNPPPWRGELVHEARFLNTLPPIGTANRQFMYNTFLEYRYGKFGDYDGYALARLPEASGPIRRLRSKLAKLEEAIRNREKHRMFPYDFLLPSRVPNSINL